MSALVVADTQSPKLIQPVRWRPRRRVHPHPTSWSTP